MRQWFLPLLLFVLFLRFPAMGQFYVGAHGGVTLPQGFYSDSRMSDNGWMFTQGHQRMAGAGKGWAGGIDVSYAFEFHPALEVVASADFMQSGVNRDVKEYYDYVFSSRYSQCASYQMVLPKFRNVNVFMGVRYAYPLTRGVDLYGEVLAGINFRQITNWTTAYASSNWVAGGGQQAAEYDNEEVCVYGRSNTFAFRLGAGFLIKKNLMLGAGFYMLGDSPLSWDRSTAVRYSVYGEIAERNATQHVDYHSLCPTLVMVQLGYRLTPFRVRRVQAW